MLHLHPPTKKWQIARLGGAMAWCLGLAFCTLVTVRAQDDQSKNKDAASASKTDAEKAETAAAKPDAVAGKAGETSEATSGAANPADPSQTRKIAPIEVFRDEKAEKLLGMETLKSMPGRPVGNGEIQAVRAQAGGADANIDRDLIRRVVQGMVAKLTNRANVQALIDPPQNQNPNADAVRAVHEATTVLLEPIFRAKSAKNERFLRVYYQILKDELTPLLNNHLIPRVQAMIVLGQCGAAQFVPIYITQVKDKAQTVWVKMWAMEGLINIIQDGGLLTASDRIEAAKAVADFLKGEPDQPDLPWPAKLRALEVLTAMRQGYEPSKPKEAAMASAAMAMLADGAAKPEVRAEAARALGQMPIASAVSKYNTPLIGYITGQLAAELGNGIATSSSGSPDKAKYLAALLIGPVYQAFDGVPGSRDSGLLHRSGGAPAPSIDKVFELIKPVVQSTIDLLSASRRQAKDRQKELLDHVAALKTFLQQNPPADPHLVPNGGFSPSTRRRGKG